MNTQEIADRFYAPAQKGEWNTIIEQLYHKDAESVEPPKAEGGLKSVKGVDQIAKKGKEWEETIEAMHGGYTKEPQVASDYFTCAMGFDATFKGRGRMKMDEIALYKVEGGKIAKEQFFY